MSIRLIQLVETAVLVLLLAGAISLLATIVFWAQKILYGC